MHDAQEAHAALSAQLEAALLRELRARWDWENYARFGERLTAPVLVLAPTTSRLGRWVRATRTLELGRAFVLGRPWPEIVSVLAHEMAHQFVDEALGVHDETAHGESFRRVCGERGIDARAAGAPAADGASPAETERALERIKKLLALAGSANQHEADAAMRKAHELMLRHNVDLAAAAAERDYEVRHVGDARKRRTLVETEIVGLLSELFFVKVIRVPVYLPREGKRGTVFELAGTHANLEMACHVYAFLLATTDRLWRQNRRDARVKSGRDRLSYQSGVVRGFRDKLRAERAQLRGTGLVWVGDAKLDDFYRARNPRIVSRRRSVRVGGAHEAGREAGGTIVLHRPIATSHEGGESKRLRG
jgi:hypothetical protein